MIFAVAKTDNYLCFVFFWSFEYYFRFPTFALAPAGARITQLPFIPFCDHLNVIGQESVLFKFILFVNCSLDFS